ncbi:MAG: hypothetical protein ABH830_03400 [Patescibacteria group bacterium]
MFDYLEKFNKLPKEIRDKVSSSEKISALVELEKKHSVNLAAVVIRVMIKEIRLDNLANYFQGSEYNFDFQKASSLARDLKEQIFSEVSDYLIKTESLLIPAKEKILTTNYNEPFNRPTNQAKGANFFFAPEDEEEIRELSAKINGYDKLNIPRVNFDDQLDEIIKATEINFGSQLLIERFQQIIRTYLRGIRDEVEIKQALRKSIADGGLGFDSESADKVMLLVKEKIKDFKKASASIKMKPAKFFLPEDKENQDKLAKVKEIGLRDLDYSFKEGEEKNLKADDIKIKERKKLAPLPPQVTTKTGQPEISAKIRQIPIKETSVNISMPRPRQTNEIKIPYRLANERSGKKRMEDVKYVPKVMNPIDELRYLDIINFRRLSPDPNQAVAKVMEKINLLAEEQFSKKNEGIKAWRESPVSNLYLRIGQDSINNNKSITDVIENRKNNKQDFLTEEEFKAVLDLNRSLRY